MRGRCRSLAVRIVESLAFDVLIVAAVILATVVAANHPAKEADKTIDAQPDQTTVWIVYSTLCAVFSAELVLKVVARGPRAYLKGAGESPCAVAHGPKAYLNGAGNIFDLMALLALYLSTWEPFLCLLQVTRLYRLPQLLRRCHLLQRGENLLQRDVLLPVFTAILLYLMLFYIVACVYLKVSPSQEQIANHNQCANLMHDIGLAQS